MKLKLKIGDDTRNVLVFDAQHATLLGQVMTAATLYTVEGYGASETIKPATSGLAIEWVDEKTLATPSDDVIKAREEAAKQRSEWFAEYQKRQKLEKELAEKTAAFEALRGSVTCVRNDEAPDSEI